MKSLYQISEERFSLEEQLIETQGELTPELIESLAINENEFLTKGRDYTFVVLSLRAKIEAIRNEKKRMDALLKQAEKAEEVLCNRLKDAMILYGKENLDFGTAKVSFRASKRVDITDEEKLPNECKVWGFTVSKSKVKELIEAGQEVEGAVIVHEKNFQIK